MKKFPSCRWIALEYKRIWYASDRELFDLLAKDRNHLIWEFEGYGITLKEYKIFHEFIWSTPIGKVAYDYPGWLIEVALRDLLSKYGVDDQLLLNLPYQ